MPRRPDGKIDFGINLLSPQTVVAAGIFFRCFPSLGLSGKSVLNRRKALKTRAMQDEKNPAY
jgi:hypothetical protein